MVRNEKERMQPSQHKTFTPDSICLKKKTYPTPGFALVHFDFNSSPFFKNTNFCQICVENHTQLWEYPAV